MPDENLTLRGVGAYYGTTQALFDVEFDAFGGEVTCLVGLNGMGKSTTLRAIAGWVTTTGSIALGSSPLPHRSDERARSGIAYVPEDRRVFGSLTVAENLNVVKARRGSEGGASGRRELFEVVYELFPRLRERIGQRASTLSGGEQQMLAVGRAIVANPIFILLDEPNEGLSPQYMQTISHAIRALRERGVGIILVEQSWSTAKSLGDRFYLLENGRVADTARPEDLAREPTRLVSRMSV